MRPGLEEAPLFPEQFLEVLWLVRPNAAEDHQLMARRDDVGRVELQEPEFLDDIEDAVSVRFALFTGQSLACDRQPPCRSRGNRANRRSLVKPALIRRQDRRRWRSGNRGEIGGRDRQTLV